MNGKLFVLTTFFSATVGTASAQVSFFDIDGGQQPDFDAAIAANGYLAQSQTRWEDLDNWGGERIDGPLNFDTDLRGGDDPIDIGPGDIPFDIEIATTLGGNNEFFAGDQTTVPGVPSNFLASVVSGDSLEIRDVADIRAMEISLLAPPAFGSSGTVTLEVFDDGGTLVGSIDNAGAPVGTGRWGIVADPGTTIGLIRVIDSDGNAGAEGTSRIATYAVPAPGVLATIGIGIAGAGSRRRSGGDAGARAR